MPSRKRIDLYRVGEELEPYECHITPDWNAQFVESLEAHYPRYHKGIDETPAFVVPGLLIANSNITRSPSLQLDPGMAAVMAKDEIQYLNPGRVGEKFKTTWRVTECFEKRGRPYQVVEALLVDEDGVQILRRKITHTFMGGPHKGAKE